MRFWTIFVLLVYLHVYDAARTVTNEDIRDAILSVVNMIRSSEDKLERHEFREKTLGDQVKKLLWAIDKRQRLDPVKGTIGRLDERLATVETILLQKDERERIQMQKVFDMVEQIHNSLPQLFETLKNDITSSLPKESEEPSPSKADLAKLQKEIEIKIDNTSKDVKSIEGQLTKIREENKNNFSSNQKFLEKYENKLTECNKQIAVLPTKWKEVNDAQTGVILKALETRDGNLKKLQQEMDASSALVKKLDVKLSTMEADNKNNSRLNESTSQNLENVKRHINESREVLKKYEEKLKEYNKKIDVLSSTYKLENEAQTKSILKAFETRNDDVQKVILTSKQEVLKNCEIVDKHLNEAFPQQKKALDNLDASLKSHKDNLEKRFNLVDKKLNDAQELVQTSRGAVEKKQSELAQTVDGFLRSLNDDITRVFENKSAATTDVIMEALGDQKTEILDSIKKFEISKEMRSHTDNLLQELRTYVKLGFENISEMNDQVLRIQVGQAMKFGEQIKEIRNVNNSIGSSYTKLSTDFREHLSDTVDVILKALEACRSKSDDSEKRVFNSILENGKNLTREIAQRISKELDKHNTFDVLRDSFELIARNISEVYNVLVKQDGELIDYNNKMDALPWKHKTENDQQTHILLQAIKSFNNETVKNVENHQTLKTNEVVQVLHDIKQNVLSTTGAIDKQHKNIRQNLQTFLQAFEKELVFVTNAATSDLKDHVDRTSSAELHEFNTKFDALSLSLLTESAMIQEAKHNTHDVKQSLLEQSKIIENRADRSRDACKEMLDTVMRSLENVGKQGKIEDTFLAAFKIAEQNEQRLIKLEDFLNATAFSQDLQRNLMMENLTVGFKQFWNEVSSQPSVDINNCTDVIVREIRINNENAERMRKVELEEIEVSANRTRADARAIFEDLAHKRAKDLEELSLKNAKFILQEIKQEKTALAETVTKKIGAALKEMGLSMHQNISSSLGLLQVGLDSLAALVSLGNNEQTELLVRAINLGESAISDLLKNVETNLNETIPHTIQTVIGKDLAEVIDYATSNLEKLSEISKDMETIKQQTDALSSIDKTLGRALENHGETFRRHVENQTLSSQHSLKNIETILGKLRESDKEHAEIISGVKEDINNVTLQLIAGCNNRTNNDDILQDFKDHSTNLQAQLREQLVAANKEHFDQISALINDTNKDVDENNLKNISALVNRTYFKLIENFDKYGAQNAKVQESIKLIEELTEALNGNVALTFERLLEEMQGLQKLEEIMTQTSDSVTDTKRRVEYGVREISMEIGNLMTSQIKDLGASVNSRFDNLHWSLIDNDNGPMANISTSLTSEFDHVWRQIGIMHQEMTLITETLGKLENNSRSCMNGTTRSIEVTRGKVTQMQTSVSQVDHNLNTLLGRFSLISQEFGQIKLALGNTLNEIRRTLQNSPTRPHLVGPGPHAINS